MFISKINILKIYVLHLCSKNKGGVSFDDIRGKLASHSINDVSYNLLSKTINAMKTEGVLEIINGKILITLTGNEMFEKNKSNLVEFTALLLETRTKQDVIFPIPPILDETIAYKTIPYRIDSLNGKTEDDFFKGKMKMNEPYIFDNRGLGKARYSLKNKRDEYSYEGYVVLFFNAGVIRFLGIVTRYDNNKKELWFDKIIKLKNPISILDIRNMVRVGFNGSQQKQEIFLEDEVQAMTTVIKEKISSGGCCVFKAEDHSKVII